MHSCKWDTIGNLEDLCKIKAPVDAPTAWYFFFLAPPWSFQKKETDMYLISMYCSALVGTFIIRAGSSSQFHIQTIQQSRGTWRSSSYTTSTPPPVWSSSCTTSSESPNCSGGQISHRLCSPSIPKHCRAVCWAHSCTHSTQTTTAILALLRDSHSVLDYTHDTTHFTKCDDNHLLPNVSIFGRPPRHHNTPLSWTHKQ